jgi:hypothetical protein
MSGLSSSNQVAVEPEDRYFLHPRMALQMPFRWNYYWKCLELNLQELKFVLLSHVGCSVVTPACVCDDSMCQCIVTKIGYSGTK